MVSDVWSSFLKFKSLSAFTDFREGHPSLAEETKGVHLRDFEMLGQKMKYLGVQTTFSTLFSKKVGNGKNNMVCRCLAA